MDMLLAMRETGLPVTALDTRPQLPSHLSWIYSQYSSLTRERVYAHDSPLPLRLADIDLYWDRFVKFNYEEFYEDIVFIDSIYLKQLGIRRESKAAKEKVANKKPGK